MHTARSAERQLEVYEAFARDLIRDNQWCRAAKRVDRILVAIDFSVCSVWALRYAEELAQRLGAEVVLVHVDQSLAPGSDLARGRLGAAAKELDDLVGLLQERGVTARAIVRSGGPVEELLAMAEKEHADLIVMGTHGRSGVSRVLMGSVAESMVRRASCPVLTVR